MEKDLNNSEKEVLKHHQNGKTCDEIAEILAISHHTVKALLTSCQKKLGK